MVTIAKAYNFGIDGLMIVRKMNGETFSIHTALKPAWTFLTSKQMYFLFALNMPIKIEEEMFIENFIETI